MWQLPKGLCSKVPTTRILLVLELEVKGVF